MALSPVPSAPPTRGTFEKLKALQPMRPIDPRLIAIRDKHLPHLDAGRVSKRRGTSTGGNTR